MLRFLRLSKENEGLRPIDLIKLYDEKFPELTEEQKLNNLKRFLKVKILKIKWRLDYLKPTIKELSEAGIRKLNTFLYSADIGFSH